VNLPEAHDTARNGADRFGNVWRVFRLPAWPPAVYSCKAGDLPAEAQILATYPKDTSPKPSALSPDPTPAAADVAQGSLF